MEVNRNKDENNMEERRAVRYSNPDIFGFRRGYCKSYNGSKEGLCV